MATPATAPDIHLYTGDASDLLQRTLERTAWSSYLDLGCGDGALLYALDSRGYFSGKKVYAVDVSEQRIQRVRALNSDFCCLVSDACNLSIIDDSSIDILVSSHVIEHVYDDDHFIQEIARVLSNNSTLYIATPYKKWYGWFYKRNNGKWMLDDTHVREYANEKDLINILAKYGFHIL